jgi:hypothetical protein
MRQSIYLLIQSLLRHPRKYGREPGKLKATTCVPLDIQGYVQGYATTYVPLDIKGPHSPRLPSPPHHM